jgi:hypothetical protein
MAKLKIAKAPSGSDLNVTYPQATYAGATPAWSGKVDAYISPTLINGAHIGGTGGLTSVGGLQIQGQVFVNNTHVSSSTTGAILAQKGAHKFRVQDGNGYVGDCVLMNTPNPTAGQMNILISLNTSTAAVAAANMAGGATSTTVTFSSVTGPVALPRPGDWLNWTSPSGNIAGFTQVQSISNGTATILTSGNVAAATGVSVTVQTYASRITNKFVYDFTSDGNMDSTTGNVTYYSAGTYNTNGNNPNRYRYVLGGSPVSPSTTIPGGFVKVQSA